MTIDNLEEWHLVVFTYNGTAIKLYIDDLPPVIKPVKGNGWSKNNYVRVIVVLWPPLNPDWNNDIEDTLYIVGE